MSTNIYKSVALCTYNGEKYLRQQLESLVCQTKLPNELVVCDDGSTDGTVKILEEFKKKSPFELRIYVNNKNLGPSKNFEKAIRLCKGDIIFLCDQDDIWLPYKLEKIENIFKVRSDIGYIFSDALVVNENMVSKGYTMWNRLNFTKKEIEKFNKGLQLPILLKHNVVTGATLAIKKDVVKHFLPIPRIWIHDAWIALSLSCTDIRGYALQDNLIKYRQHPRQVIGGEKISLFKKIKQLSIQNLKDIEDGYLKFSKTEELYGLSKKCKNNNRKFLIEKIEHLNMRMVSYHSKPIKASLIILREFLMGRYNRYSNGAHSAIKDLILVLLK